MTLQPKLTLADDIGGPYDAVILAVKAYGLDQAIEDMKPAIGPDTMIMPLLNGMRHVEVIRERHEAALIGGVCKVATTVDAEGRIRQLAPFQELAYGELDGTSSRRTAALDAAMREAGFTARLTPTIEREMWEKWTLLATMGGMCCLMRGTIGEIEAAPGGREFTLRLLDEVVRVISTDGVAPSAGFLKTIRQQLVRKGLPAMASSMYRDLVAGQKVEADQILGDLVTRGVRHGLETPLLAASYSHMCVHAARMARS